MVDVSSAIAEYEASRAHRLLLVEDDVSIANLIRIGMKRLGLRCEMDIAYSGEEGLEQWHRHPYDILITDYNLRGITGFDLIQRLNINTLVTPVVLCTAYDTPSMQQYAQQLGVAAYIPKPFFIDQFVCTVNNLLIA
ncbi:MAG: response regulator [Chloroflexota bacterium]